MKNIKSKIYDLILRLAHKDIYKYYNRYMQTQWLSRKDLETLQYEETKKILEYAYENFNFYKRKFDTAGVSPKDFKNLKDIEKFPMTGIPELKQALKDGEFSHYNEEDVQYFSTTGSTGTPFVFPINKSSEDQRYGSYFRNQQWYGHSFGKKNARLWRMSKKETELQSKDSFFRNEYNKLIKRPVFWNQLKLSIYDSDHPEESFLDDAKLKTFCDKLIENKIKIIESYVSALTLLSDYIVRNNVKGFEVEKVVSSAEYLSPYARKLIEKAFGCKVVNRYGGSEISTMAHQCGQDDGECLHIISDRILLEVVKDGKSVPPGEMGEVVITDFYNKSMPFIRFKVGDVAFAEDKNKLCECGRSLHLLRSVEGRINDLFLLPNGNVLVSHVWHKLFREQKEIKEFQIIQRKSDLFDVYTILENPDYDYLPLQDEVQKFLPGCTVNWHVVDIIKSGSGGKFRHSMSEVPFHLNEIRGNKVAPTRGVGNIAPYRVTSSQRALERRCSALKLDWNEGTISPPSNVTDKVLSLIKEKNYLNWYPDITHTELKNNLSRFNNIDVENVEVFVGSDGALDYIAKTFIDADDTVTIVSPTYDQFRVYLELAGAKCEYVYNKDPFVWDYDHIVSQISKNTKLIYIVNPNNPTGVVVDREDIEKLLTSFPNAIVLVDEAYIEFCLEKSSVPLAGKYKNLFVLRTFSKAFCLAGLRIGYLIAHKQYLDLIRRIKNTKEVNSIALAAAAEALNSWDYYKEYIDAVIDAKKNLIASFEANNHEVYGDGGNFIMLKAHSPSGLIAYLSDHDVYIRDRSYMHQLDNFVRITVGTSEQMERLLKLVNNYMNETIGNL